MAIDNSKIIGKILLILACLLLAIVFVVFVLEKTQVINLYTKPIDQKVSTQATLDRPVNSIDYTPENTQTDSSINSEKQNTQNSTSTSTDNSINVNITRASYNPSSKQIIVSAIIEGATNGTCTLLITQNSIAKLKLDAPISSQGSYSICQGFNIDAKDFVSGKYLLQVNATSGNQNGTSSQEVSF